ncbi:N-acetylglucosamine-specific PTS transporter subunit IIBC [Sphingomonas sp. LB-2]|uniref:N-acetylglucosamine-specific PTS transporter subunit IIBC n=1 Tax=Sphingomonas caeni TaxID=2984949 RepID=UPI002232AF0F|nr:N-acetylglucosamine-specific PTS transporter subunit IIBC [Sphingomonas caeni]MCW3848035.1 N-acetylglucosamine-specific PTS transporter subunit IIBC [Sphingomonas caeni]
MRKAIETLQPLGRALMLPIAVLPVAALLLRLGQPDLLDIAFVSAAGDAIFNHLGLLFAVGVATGFARDGNGAAALAGVVCFLVTGQGLKLFIAVPPEAIQAFTGDAVKLATNAFKDGAVAKLEVPIGILSGLIGGNFYNRFSGIKLPEYLAFFGGRRFVPIAAGVAGLVLAGLIGLGYEQITTGMDTASRAVVGAGGVGLFAFGVINRLLIVTGLHHIINNIAWFVVGDFQGTTGDLRRFFAGDPSAGAFMSGFFPVMMFGLPAACLAMYHEARPERRKAVAGMFFSLALTSFLTGVTEPIEFTFMFLAPLLYLIHAVLTGIAMALMDALNVKLGFGFSAGLFDYVLNFGKATNPWLLLPVGGVYALLYYGLFRVVIRKFDLKTPGREADEAPAPAPAVAALPRGSAFVAAFGGAANLESVDACTTRLRLIVRDQAAIDEAALKALGSRGIVKPSAKAVQVVLGPIADAVAMEMRDAMGAAGAGTPATTTTARADLSPALVTALGGADNIRDATRLHGRLRIQLIDAARSNLEAASAGFRGAVALPGNVVHLLEGPA